MSKDLSYYLQLRYKIELIPEEDGSWGAVIPELPGCVGGGDTIAEPLEKGAPVCAPYKNNLQSNLLAHGF